MFPGPLLPQAYGRVFAGRHSTADPGLRPEQDDGSGLEGEAARKERWPEGEAARKERRPEGEAARKESRPGRRADPEGEAAGRRAGRGHVHCGKALKCSSEQEGKNWSTLSKQVTGFFWDRFWFSRFTLAFCVSGL